MLKIPIFKIIKHSKNISNEKKFGKGPLKILESEMEKKCLNSLIISAFPNISNRKDKPNMAKKRPEKTFQVTFFQENHKVRSISAFLLINKGKIKGDFFRKYAKDGVAFSLRDMRCAAPLRKWT